MGVVMSESDRPGMQYEYEKIVAYSLLLSEALFEVLKAKGLLTREEVTESMERLNKELVCRTRCIEFPEKGTN